MFFMWLSNWPSTLRAQFYIPKGQDMENICPRDILKYFIAYWRCFTVTCHQLEGQVAMSTMSLAEFHNVLIWSLLLIYQWLQHATLIPRTEWSMLQQFLHYCNLDWYWSSATCVIQRSRILRCAFYFELVANGELCIDVSRPVGLHSFGTYSTLQQETISAEGKCQMMN